MLPDDVLNSTLDVFPTEITVLNSDGAIVYTNGAWREFAYDNDMTSSEDPPGVNYLEVTRQAPDDDSSFSTYPFATKL